MLKSQGERRAPDTGLRHQLERTCCQAGALQTLTVRVQFLCALKLVGLYSFQILLLDLAIISLDILINLSFPIPFVHIAEFLSTATSCGSDCHHLITTSNSIGNSVCFTCGPVAPLAAGCPALTQLHGQNQGGQQLERGMGVRNTVAC